MTPAGPLLIGPSVEPAGDYPSGVPIPTAQDAPSDKQFCAIYKAWANRVIVGEYRRSHSGDRNVPAFLSEAFLYLLGTNDRTRNRLSLRAEDLERIGSNDPVFQLMAGLVQSDAPKRERLYRLAITGFPKTNYSRFLLFVAAANLAKSLEERKAGAADIAEADRIALEGLRDGLDKESFHADEMPALRWRLCSGSADSLFRRHGAEGSDILNQAANVPDWIKEFAQGRGYQLAAWAARTDDWADKVTEAGLAGWRRNLAKAREHFTKAWELNRKDPGAAACMIEVAMGDGGDKQELRRWFDRSVAAQMDFPEAYRSMIWALRPRWHGSHAEMLQFADDCLRTGRFDTQVPAYYFKVVREVSSEERDPEAIYKRPEIYRNFKLALDSYLGSTDIPFSLSYGHTLAAIIDYKNGNLVATRTHMAAVQFQPDPAADLGLLEDLPKMMKAISAP